MSSILIILLRKVVLDYIELVLMKLSLSKGIITPIFFFLLLKGIYFIVERIFTPKNSKYDNSLETFELRGHIQ
jgi:hypothetical protein